MTPTTTSCPRCGAPAAADKSRCPNCGFAFFETSVRRSLPRPSRRWTMLTLLALAGGVGVAVLLAREPSPEPLEPVPAARAEQRLERRLRGGGREPSGSVRCRDEIRPGRLTRCQFVYRDRDTQLLLVSIAADGELDIEVPYPAQRRPGD